VTYEVGKNEVREVLDVTLQNLEAFSIAGMLSLRSEQFLQPLELTFHCLQELFIPTPSDSKLRSFIFSMFLHALNYLQAVGIKIIILFWPSHNLKNPIQHLFCSLLFLFPSFFFYERNDSIRRCCSHSRIR